MFSVVIPTWQRAELLSRTLDSLGQQTEKDFEVLVVSDGEDPDARRLAHGYRAPFALRWMFIDPHRGTCGSTSRAGAEAAFGEYLLFLDDDMALAPDALFEHARAQQAAEGWPRVVCGRIVEVYPEPPHSYTERRLRARRDEITRQGELQPAWEFASAQAVYCGTNCSISRSEYLRHGGHDTDPRMVIGMDMELGARLYDRGVRFLYAGAAVGYHHGAWNPMKPTSVRRLSMLAGVDLYCVRERNQRVPRTEALASMRRGSWLHRVKERLAWHAPGLCGDLARLCNRAADAWESPLAFRMWNSFLSSVYWSGVKSQGLTLDDLKKLVGDPLPILMFHGVAAPISALERRHHVAPVHLRRMLNWLRQRDYHCLKSTLRVSEAVPPRSVWLTFDDGYEDFHREALPLLLERRLTATVFVVVDRIGQTNAWGEAQGRTGRRLLGAEQIRELHRHGIEIGSHSLTHLWLPDVSDTELRREVRDSKVRLEDLLGAPVTCFAYPFGGVDVRVRAAVGEAGYLSAVSTEEGLSLWEDRLSLHRIAVSENDSFLDFLLKLRWGKSPWRDMRTDVRGRLSGAVRRLRIRGRADRWPRRAASESTSPEEHQFRGTRPHG
jgi:peptidoglycan/xylan/chitin deacetylase (PgdA/CDA1 family)